MITIHRLTALPAEFKPEGLYIIKDPDKPTLASVYVTGKTKEVIYHTMLPSEIEALIGQKLQENGNGVKQVDLLPDPTEHRGELYCLNGVNTPCWSDGTEWYDLSKTVIQRASSSLDSAVLRRLRDKAVFGINLI